MSAPRWNKFFGQFAYVYSKPKSNIGKLGLSVASRKFLVNNFGTSILTCSAADNKMREWWGIYITEGDLADKLAYNVETIVKHLLKEDKNIREIYLDYQKTLKNKLVLKFKKDWIKMKFEVLQLLGYLESAPKELVESVCDLFFEHMGIKDDNSKINITCAIAEYFTNLAFQELRNAASQNDQSYPTPRYIHPLSDYSEHVKTHGSKALPMPTCFGVIKAHFLCPTNLANATVECITSGLSFAGDACLNYGTKNCSCIQCLPKTVATAFGVSCKIGAFAGAAVNVVTAATAKIMTGSGIAEAVSLSGCARKPQDQSMDEKPELKASGHARRRSSWHNPEEFDKLAAENFVATPATIEDAVSHIRSLATSPTSEHKSKKSFNESEKSKSRVVGPVPLITTKSIHSMLQKRKTQHQLRLCKSSVGESKAFELKNIKPAEHKKSKSQHHVRHASSGTLFTSDPFFPKLVDESKDKPIVSMLLERRGIARHHSRHKSAAARKSSHGRKLTEGITTIPELPGAVPESTSNKLKL